MQEREEEERRTAVLPGEEEPETLLEEEEPETQPEVGLVMNRGKEQGLGAWWMSR